HPVQEIRVNGYHVGDFGADITSKKTFLILEDTNKIFVRKNVWLPKQSDLLLLFAFTDWGKDINAVTPMFFNYIKYEITDNNDIYSLKSNEIEKYMLMFYMDYEHNKIWDGTNWIDKQ